MDSKPRVIVITGANRGIGFELAKRLLKNPSKPIIIITSRNESTGKTAIRELTEQNPTSKESLYYHVLDITNKETYSPFAKWIKLTFGKFDVLVNNAGILADGDSMFNKEYKSNLTDAQRVIGTNYINTREFTEYVYPLLSTDGKIINVSSTRGQYDWQGKNFHEKLTNPKFQPKELEEIHDLFIDSVKKQNFEEVEITPSSYNVSKALLTAWTYYVLKENLKGDQQTFAMCPGWCRTDMGGEKATKSAEEGPETIEYLIDLPYKLNKEINGKFFRDNAIVELN